MRDKSELERTVEYAIGGAPQLKPDEKRKWLGEFRERVILGLTIEQAYNSSAKNYVEEALKDNMAEIIIVNQKISMNIISKYMKLAKDTNKEFKTVASDSQKAMGIVIASRQAVERENVEVEIKEKLENSKEPAKEENTGIWNRLTRIFKK